MERTRHAVLAALLVVLSVGGVALAAGVDPAGEAAAAVSWPVSTLLVSEVQTGGTSASDEFAELTNAGASPVDLAGLEVAYATSTGSTVTRKAAWTASLVLEPGRHLLIANSSGVYAGLADMTYTGGFAATGGTIVLRAIGGAPIDAVGWGDATNAFVEGGAVGGPAAGASIERRPAGIAGNTQDTNDNAADFLLQPVPNPQALAAPPVPVPGPSGTTASSPPATDAPTAEATLGPTAQPSAPPTAPPATDAPTAEPSLSPTAAPSVEPSIIPTPLPSVGFTAAPTFLPTDQPSTLPTAQATPATTPLPTPEISAAPTPEPTAASTATTAPVAATPILEARGLPDGSTTTIEGVLTTSLGALESARKAFLQDATGGIALYLDAPVVTALPAGTLLRVTGTIDERFAERTMRAAEADVIALGAQALPQAASIETGAAGEPIEGSRVVLQGLTVGAPSELSDGLGLMVDDGTGAVRVIVAPAALGGATVPSGSIVAASGPVGQRDSSGTGSSGYRVHATEPGDFMVLPPPSPAPSATPPATTPAPSAAPTVSPSSSPRPSAAPTASPAPSPTPSPTATPGPAMSTIQQARAASIGATVKVSGVVTAEAGRLGSPPLLAIADSTGAIVVRVPDGVPTPARGATVVVQGKLADPYGQLEIRPATSGFVVTGSGSMPNPVRLTADQLGEATEGRLAELTGTATGTARKGTSGDFTVDLVDAAGDAFRITCDGSSAIEPGTFAKNATYRLVGIVGQRASRKGALDGYRLHPRSPSDVVTVAGASGPSETPSPGATSGPGGSGSPKVVSIATALAYPDATPATVEGIVTVPADLLDATGRRIVVQDGTGAIEVLVPSGSSAPANGTKVRVTGKTGHAYGAPRLGATDVASLGRGSVTPASLARPPAERDEWLLVRISGTIEKVERMGDRWKAEIALAGGGRAPIQGQAGAAIPSTALITGRKITVTGIVRRPYPTATDRRFAVLPRDRGDVAVGPGGAGNAGNDDGGPGAGGMHGGPVASAVPGVDITPDTDLAVLADHVGERVRVGGLIERLGEDGLDLDDGTALAHVRLTESMAALLPHLHPGEAIAATGLVELVEGAAMVIVDDHGTLFRVGSLGQALPVAGAAPRGSATTGAGAVEADATGLGPDLTPTSIFAFAGLALLSVAATFARRRLVQRRLRGSLVARLSALRAGQDEPAGEPEALVRDRRIGAGDASGPAEPEPLRG